MIGYEAEHVMSGGAAARHQELASDICLGLTVWNRMLHSLGLPDEATTVLNLADDVFSLIADHFRAQQETSPGQSILLAVRSLLAAGLAHIQSVDTPGAPPYHFAFERGCSFRGGSDGPGALVLAALGLGALMTRRRRASHLEKTCQ